MGRDLLSNPYGRFFNLPNELGRLGHEVNIALLNYRDEPDAQRQYQKVNMYGASAWRGSYFRLIRSLIAKHSPDWIFGFSDTYFGILADKYAGQYGMKLLVDAYDNFEGYLPWCTPLHWLWRKALQRATVITAAGPALLDLMVQGSGGRCSAVLPMAVDSVAFRPRVREQCRAELGLPINRTLVGYSGSVAPNRGLETLFAAIEHLQGRAKDVRLVMSGRKVGRVKLPPDAIWLGTLNEEAVPKVMSSMNVVTVVNRLSKFGTHSYPVKLYEAMSCRVPVVASRTPATEWILARFPELLFTPEDPVALADRIEFAIKLDTLDYGALPTWRDNGRALEALLVRAGA